MRNGARVRPGAVRAAMSVAPVKDHRCDRCGYQIATEPPFPRCPMCGAEDRRPVGLLSRRYGAAAV
jgi:rubrerythrin